LSLRPFRPALPVHGTIECSRPVLPVSPCCTGKACGSQGHALLLPQSWLPRMFCRCRWASPACWTLLLFPVWPTLRRVQPAGNREVGAASLVEFTSISHLESPAPAFLAVNSYALGCFCFNATAVADATGKPLAGMLQCDHHGFDSREWIIGPVQSGVAKVLAHGSLEHHEGFAGVAIQDRRCVVAPSV